MKTWKTATRDKVKGIVLRDIDRELHELPASAFGADVSHDKDGNPVEVNVVEERFLPFAPPGKRVANKRLYTVIAEKPDGTVVQVPLEDQINNNVAAPDMFIGLQFYTRKGFNVFFDLETGVGAVCPTWDCWAEWNPKLEGFCTQVHKDITRPAKTAGAFEDNSTTSQIWG